MFPNVSHRLTQSDACQTSAACKGAVLERESQTHPKWCLPEKRSLQRRVAQCESLTHRRWCLPEICSLQRQTPQRESQTQWWWLKLCSCSNWKQSWKFVCSLRECSREKVPVYGQGHLLLLKLPLHFFCRWQLLLLQPPAALLRPVSEHHPSPWLSCYEAALLWAVCSPSDLPLLGASPQAWSSTPQEWSPSEPEGWWHRLVRFSIEVHKTWLQRTQTQPSVYF